MPQKYSNLCFPGKKAERKTANSYVYWRILLVQDVIYKTKCFRIPTKSLSKFIAHISTANPFFLDINNILFFCFFSPAENDLSRDGGSSSSHRSRRHRSSHSREEGGERDRERERERKHRHKDRHRSRSHSHRRKKKRCRFYSSLKLAEICIMTCVA